MDPRGYSKQEERRVAHAVDKARRVASMIVCGCTVKQAESGDAYGSLGAPPDPLPVEAGEKRPHTREEKEVRSKLQSEQRPVGDDNFHLHPG